MDEKEILIRQLNREKDARHVAEKILEEKSLELYKLNSELRETIQSLSEHENRILSILNVSEDGILVFDRSLQIKTANISACSILGYNESQLLGSSIELLFPHDDFKMILNTMLEGKIEKAPIRRPFEIQGITKANKIIPIEMSLSLYDHTEESNILCIFHNSHKKKQTEIYFEIKRQFPKILDENIPFEDVFKNILQLLVTHLHLDVGLAWLVNTENISSYQCSYTQDPFSFNDFINESKKIKFAPGLGLPGRTVQSKQIEWIENIHTDENFHRTEIIKNIPLSCGFAFPVFF